ncbi:hypothetical protein VCHA50P415_70117 [Vibrio chagasii]|nr:hypothetical protein VCHA27O13_120083 [Vibrio chagasii]CAH6794514.1 hypothetical protein VCHA35O141_100023 [Vibrio chagasii]CAH6799499.1 hypothetical protein VCHA35O135_100118 [Vibrio chagasii]CAH6819524.1 hypothetical protein VCHA34P112_150079 [Vibrio chagasii]CAH6829439.1 hypothetical protein VCHA32O87_160032 [Vibrio chagasii]
MTYFRYSLSSTLVSFSYLDASTLPTEHDVALRSRKAPHQHIPSLNDIC